MRTRTKVIATGLALLLPAWTAYSMYTRIPESPEQALRLFHEAKSAEDQLMDPLILAGTDVVPLVIRELPDPNMSRRRYAIGALGNIGSDSAVPALTSLVDAPSEPDYIRCDALAAIVMIDEEKGLQAAKSVGDQVPECLAETAAQLQHDLEGWSRSNALRRTYFQALLGWHY